MRLGLQREEDETIVRYLLGDLPQPVGAQLEERYFCEPPFFDRVADLEQQLIRRYLEGKLSPVDASLFERKYFRVPELHKKVELIRHLREEAGLSMQDQRSPHPVKTSRWHRMLRPVVVIPAFAAVPLLMGIGFWLAAENTRLRTELSQARSSSAAVKVNPGAGKAISSSSEEVFSLTLFPGLSKSVVGEQSRRVGWNSGLKEIRIDFELPGLTGDSPLALEVMLVEPHGRRTVLDRNGLPSIATTSGRALVFVARPAELVPGDYIAFVKQRIQGTDEVLESYSFSVLLQ